MSQIRAKDFYVADTPRVQVYENFVMYDRFMNYDRFNSYCNDNLNPLDSDEQETKYYEDNHMNFLVLKTCFNPYEKYMDVLLYDIQYSNIYLLGNSTHDYRADVVFEYSDFYKMSIPTLKIVDTRPTGVYCIGIDEDVWCSNVHTNKNGYCDLCKHLSDELKDINIDRLLTYKEFCELPCQSHLIKEDRNYVHEDDKSDEENDDDDGYRRYHTYDSDTDFSDNDGDFDDRRHGPEHTIEDEEDEIKKEEEDIFEVIKSSLDKLNISIDKNKIFSYVYKLLNIFDLQSERDEKLEIVSIMMTVLDTSSGHVFLKDHEKFAKTVLSKLYQFKNDLTDQTSTEISKKYVEAFDKYIEHTKNIYDNHDKNSL